MPTTISMPATFGKHISFSCEIEKKRLECAIVMKAIRMEQAEQAAAESNS